MAVTNPTSVRSYVGTRPGTGPGLTLLGLTPFRIQTHAIAGSLPGQLRMQFKFVPEPNATLLLVAGVAGLLVLAGWRKQASTRSR